MEILMDVNELWKKAEKMTLGELLQEVYALTCNNIRLVNGPVVSGQARAFRCFKQKSVSNFGFGPVSHATFVANKIAIAGTRSVKIVDSEDFALSCRHPAIHSRPGAVTTLPITTASSAMKLQRSGTAHVAVAASHVGKLSLWDIAAMKQVACIDERLVSISASHTDGNWLAGCGNNTVKLWDLRESHFESWQPRSSKQEKGMSFTDVILTEDGTTLIAAGTKAVRQQQHGMLLGWDVRINNDKQKIITKEFPTPIQSLGLHPYGQCVAVGLATPHIVTVMALAHQGSYDIPFDSTPKAIAFAGDGRTMACAEDHKIRFHRVDDNTQIDSQLRFRPTSDVTAFEFSNDHGKLLAGESRGVHLFRRCLPKLNPGRFKI